MTQVTNILTFDVESWYQSSLAILDASEEPDGVVYPTEEVVEQTTRLLEILAEAGTRATFFVLGTVAERFPELVRRVWEAGHEIGTHGYGHWLIYRLTPEEFAADLRRSLDLLEAVTGEPVVSHRAPYFSITRDSLWALEVLAQHGIRYDSSVFPTRRSLYGIPDAPRFPYTVDFANGDRLLEAPLATLKLCQINLPVAGGGYLRLLPYPIIAYGIQRLNDAGHPAVVYLHPYELEQERAWPDALPRTLKNRLTMATQNLNRARTLGKLQALLRDFRFSSLREVLSDA